MDDHRAVDAGADQSLAALAAELTAAAYPVALRHAVGDKWLDLQLELWWALTGQEAVRRPLGGPILSRALQKLPRHERPGDAPLSTRAYKASIFWLSFFPHGPRKTSADLPGMVVALSRARHRPGS